ncbi:hypothetical protein Y032_0525g2926 [Ancylostoma ceylanicum]|nr:hypothetical protein Y032_0525g2926 [Ancylostoma ceylanicum]
MDGLMYCEVCGTQIFDFREVEADEDQLVGGFGKIRTKKVREQVDKSLGKTDFVALGLSTAVAGKKRKGEALRSLAPTKGTREVEHDKPSKLSKDITSGREHAPSYLRCVGTRLSAFTKILAKGVTQIRRDSAVPDGFADHTFAIFQRYLSVCNVAFTSNDYTDDLEKMFRALVLNTNIAFERAREKKAKLERRKKRGKEALQKSLTAWDLLMGDTLDENLELRSDDEHIDDEEPNNEHPSTSTTPSKPQMVSVVDTKIPKEVLDNASAFYVGMDVLVAILYVSVITIGCRWIVLSDIIRWIREDRMSITLFQRTALDYASIQGSKKSKTGSWSNMDLPLYEFQRTALFIWQLCRLPPTPAKIDFKQVVARLLYHVNLPEAMMERVLVLINAAPPCARLDDESLRRQGRIEQGPYANGFNTVGEKFSISHMLHAFGRMKRHRSDTYTDIFFSTETKAFAFILMVLKLSFGLDDSTEVALSKQVEGKGRSVFNFMEWFYQLKMRMMFWEGYDPLDILQTSRPVEPLYYENEFPRGENTHFYIHSNQDAKTAYAFRHYPRDSGFIHCVPSKIRIDSSTSIPNPFSEETYDAQSNRNDDESLYVPLRSQENVLRAFLMRPRSEDEKQEIRTMVDEEAVKVFKANYELKVLRSASSWKGRHQVALANRVPHSAGHVSLVPKITSVILVLTGQMQASSI